MNYPTSLAHEFERMSTKSQEALAIQTATAQRLKAQLADAEAEVTGLHQRLQTAEQQINRLYDDLDAKDRELARAYAWARVWKQAAKMYYHDYYQIRDMYWLCQEALIDATEDKNDYVAYSNALREKLARALAVVDAARDAAAELDKRSFARKPLERALAAYDAAQQAQPEAKP